MKVKEFNSEEEINEFLAKNIDVEVVSITPIIGEYYATTGDYNPMPGEYRKCIWYVLQYEDVKAVNDERIGVLFDMVYTSIESFTLVDGSDFETAKEEFTETFKQWYLRVILNQNIES